MKNSINTRLEGRLLKLSNLTKILYPDCSCTKAEVIQYYLDIAPLILKYVKNRPLTLIRFPDGVDRKQFYSKSRPEWTPDWIPGYSFQHSEDIIDYIVAKEQAAIIWLANLAALEIHPMQFTIQEPDLADQLIFDLDIEEVEQFTELKQIAFRLKEFLESYNYSPFLKTSGSKGLHIYIPIKANCTHHELVECAKLLAHLFVTQNTGNCTLEFSKDRREGKILIDIFRNHKSHTTVSPYSLRGKSGAPISFPMLWQELNDIHNSKHFNIRNYKSILESRGDAWKDFYESATVLHTIREKRINANFASQDLKEYFDKRDFSKSPEPLPGEDNRIGNRFSIQLHDAKNLHYDLRLEDNGVLLSWAIPKGFPFESGIKHLAIQTENHPLQYLTFEGIIPKGQYGAGKMWVFARGTFKWLERSENKLKFELKSSDFNRSFRMFKTNNDQWLIELLENKDFTRVNLPLSPMLANSRKYLPLDHNFLYEIKWDGIRASLYLENEKIIIYSRSGRDITSQFPDLVLPEVFDVESGIFDGEIVSLDKNGVPVFSQVISRMHSNTDSKNSLHKYQTVLYLFDCVFLDGKYITNESLIKRKDWLNASIKKNNTIRISESLDDGQALFDAGKELGLEGVMVKVKTSQYQPGLRSDNWLKVKYRTKTHCLIAGYTKGQGDRADLFGAIHIIEKSNNAESIYRGKVGTGFDSKKMKILLNKFAELTSSVKPFKTQTEDDNSSIWITPVLECEIEYASLTSNGTYREAVFIKLINES